jgi:hypothetical protein
MRTPDLDDDHGHDEWDVDLTSQNRDSLVMPRISRTVAEQIAQNWLSGGAATITELNGDSDDD